MSLKSYLRQLVLTPAEQQALAFTQAWLRPAENLYTRNGRWNPAEPGGHMTITWGTKPPLGWLEDVRQQGPRITINHIAVATEFVGYSYARRLAHSFGQAVKQHAGVTEILFTEYKQSTLPGYPAFFAKLGATQMPSATKGFEWLWTIP
ncbi:hypothetical protein [Dechloromonas hortensis]|uniref:hypothetical protein n=1 Tax=Dechloromonas hortensis TaxID=337779 RepID=UPI001290CBCC|nr:hypothetical protein [Dechloromonas hortensis]